MAQALFDALAAGVDQQTALAVQHLLDSQSVPEQHTQQAVEEEDIYQCGKCKKQFYNIGTFLGHKQTCRGQQQQTQHQTLRPPPQPPGSNPNSAFTSSVPHAINRQVYRDVAAAYSSVPPSPLTQLAQGMVITDDLMTFTLDQTTPALQVGTSIQGNPFLSQVSPLAQRTVTSAPIPAFTAMTSAQVSSAPVFSTAIQLQHALSQQQQPLTPQPVTASAPIIVKAVSGKQKRSQANANNSSSLLTSVDSYGSPIKSVGRTKRSDAEKKQKCQYCEKTFMKNFDLQQHMRSHTGEKPFQCIVCGRAFAQKSNVKKHMQTHKVWPSGIANTLPKEPLVAIVEENVPDDQLAKKPDDESFRIMIDNSYICQYCPEKFGTYFQLKTHMVLHKDEQVYKCVLKTCLESFRELDAFLTHVKTHETDMTYRCHMCNKQFINLQELGLHQYTHSLYPNQGSKPGARFFKCIKCSNKYSTPEALEHHMQTTNHNYACPHCEKSFTCERYLRRHLPVHGTLGEHQCTVCEKRFKTEHYLKLHALIHTGVKPYKCETCAAAFNRKDKLSRHMTIHDPNKRFKCPFRTHTGCKKEFNRPDKLKSHIITHSGIKPFKCQQCGKSFSRRPHLREHQMSHEDNFKFRCDTCGKGFHREKFLQVHKCRLTKPSDHAPVRRVGRRKVGRPRKFYGELSESEVQTTAEKRGRGRPRKYPLKTDEEDQEETVEKEDDSQTGVDMTDGESLETSQRNEQQTAAFVLKPNGGNFTIPVLLAQDSSGQGASVLVQGVQSSDNTINENCGQQLIFTASGTVQPVIVSETDSGSTQVHYVTSDIVQQDSDHTEEQPDNDSSVHFINNEDEGSPYQNIDNYTAEEENDPVLQGTENLLEESEEILKSADH